MNIDINASIFFKDKFWLCTWYTTGYLVGIIKKKLSGRELFSSN